MASAAAPGPQPRSVFIAALLYLFGEKSDVLAEICIRIFDHIVKAKQPSDAAVYELSMFGLAFGTCLVVFLSARAQGRNRADDWTIAIGVITATLAGVLNLADTWMNDAALKGSVVLLQVLFFMALWVLLILFPLLLQLLRAAALSGVIATALCLVVAALVSVAYRWGAASLLWQGLGAAESANAAWDRLIYNADTLIILGASWAMAGFAPGRGYAWRLGYALAVIPAAAAYPLIFNEAGDWPVPYSQVVLGYVLLSLAALLPMSRFTERIWQGDAKALGAAAALGFVACGAVMAATLGRVWPDMSTAEAWALALVQAGAGALVPVSVFLAGRIHAGFGARRSPP